MERDVLHLLLVLLHGRDVLHEPQRLALPLQQHPVDVDPHDLARHLAHAALLPVVLAGGQHRIGVAAEGQKVLAVHIHLFGRAPLQRAGRIAKDAFQRRVAPDDDAVLDLGNADQVVVQHGLLLQVQRVQLLARRVQLAHVVHDGAAHHVLALRIEDGGGRHAHPALLAAPATQVEFQRPDLAVLQEHREILSKQRPAFVIKKVRRAQLADDLLARQAQPLQGQQIQVHVLALAVQRVVAAGRVVVQVLELLRGLCQLGLQVVALCHVTPHQLPLHQLALVVIQRPVAELTPADGAIARHHAVFHHHQGLRGADALQRPRDHGQVVRVHDGRPHLAHDLVAAQMEQSAERLVHKGHAVAGVKPADHLGLVFQDGQIPLLALVQGLRALGHALLQLGIGALQRGPPLQQTLRHVLQRRAQVLKFQRLHIDVECGHLPGGLHFLCGLGQALQRLAESPCHPVSQPGQ